MKMIVATQKTNCVCTSWTGNTVNEVTRGATVSSTFSLPIPILDLSLVAHKFEKFFLTDCLQTLCHTILIIYVFHVCFPKVFSIVKCDIAL